MANLAPTANAKYLCMTTYNAKLWADIGLYIPNLEESVFLKTSKMDMDDFLTKYYTSDKPKKAC